MTIEQAVIVGTLTLSNGLTMLTCIWLFGRVRHLEGMLEGRRSVVAAVQQSPSET